MPSRKHYAERIKKLLNEVAFFEDFTDEEKSMLAGSSDMILPYTNGDRIIKQGEFDRAIFILLEGELTITRNEAPGKELNVLKKGALFGEIPFINKGLRTTNVVAMGKVLVLKIEEYVFKEFSPEIRSKLELKLLKLLAGRLDQMNAAMARQKAEFESFHQAFEHIRTGIKNILATSEELHLIQNFSEFYCKELKK